MVTVEFGKENYHEQGIMINWCNKYIGTNPPYSDWCWATPDKWPKDNKWAIQSMFGTTFFYFKEEKDATMFILKWK